MSARYVIQWFGPYRSDPMLDPDDDHVLMLRIPVPVGEMCLGCGEAIQERDHGRMVPLCEGPLEAPTARLAPWHRECLDLGVSGHLVGICGCTNYLGLTRRQAAIEADRRLRRTVSPTSSPTPDSLPN